MHLEFCVRSRKFVERCIVSNEDNVFELQGLRRQKGGPRQEAHERVYGVGPGCEAKTGRSVPPASQRRAVENTGQVMAVSVARSLCACVNILNRQAER